MTLNKFTLLAATAAVGAFGASSAQAQFAFPTATIVGAGASLVQNVTRQAGDCYGVNTTLGFAQSSGTPQAAVTLNLFDYNTPAVDTLANRFNCAVRNVQPAVTARYVSTGSGQGVLAFLANRVSSSWAWSSGFTAYGKDDGYQYSFSETPLTAANITTYNTTANVNPFDRFGVGTPKTAAAAFGPAIQIPVVLTAVSVGYSPVYAKVRAPDGSVIPLSFRVAGGTATGGLKLTRAQYCGIFNGVITNWNQLPTNVVNKSSADLAPFDVPIVLVGRSETSGTTSLFTRAIAAQCTGLSVPNGVGGTGPAVAITNKFVDSENRLPYNTATQVAGTAYTGATSTISPTSSISGAFFDKGTGTLSGTEAAGLFTIANGNDGVALATAYHPDPGANPGDRTLNGRINYISPEQTLPAAAVTGANSLGLHNAALGVLLASGTTTYYMPTAANATAAFGTIKPPQSKGGAGAYCSDTPAACNAISPGYYGDRANPLDWVASPLKTAAIANPAKGYPIVGTSNALLYTCYATPERRQAVNGFFATLVGKTPKDSLNVSMPATLATSGTAGIFAKTGLSGLPAAWRTAIAETFFKKSLQVGVVGQPTTQLGLRNLWIQDRIPTGAPPAVTGVVNGNTTICAGKVGA